MADDIDVLGQSLLNRQRTNRKRSDKRSRKERNINLGLNLAAKGVGYANTYLKNRADTFVNEQEELVGTRIRQQKAIAQSQATIADMDAAQAHATGPEGWLAQEKFAPIIAANIERDYNTNKYSPIEIENLVYDEAAKQAKTYFPSFQKSYDAAMSMGSIEDYDAYVKTKNGRAENVGGFLFNKLTRSLNNKTQADIDQGVIESLRKNRFTNKADAMLAFDSVLKRGYSLEDAKNLSSEIDFLAGVNPPRIAGTITNQVTKEISEGRRKYSIPLVETITKDERNNQTTTYSQTYTEEAGVKTYTNGDLYNKWVGSRQGISAPPETAPDATAFNPIDIPRMIKENKAEFGAISVGTIVPEEWPLKRDFRIQQQDVLLREDGLTNEVLIATIEVRTPIEGSLATTGISAVPQGALDTFTVNLKTIANNIRTIGGNTLTQDQLFTMVATGGHKKSIRDFDKQDLKGIAHLKDIDNLQAQVAGYAYLFKLDKMTNNPLFAEEKQEDLETLALATQLMPYLTGLGEDADSYQISANAIYPRDFPNSSVLIAEQHLTASYSGGWNGMDEDAYENLVILSFDEMKDEISGDNELSLKGDALAGQFMRIDQVKNTTIPLANLPEKLRTLITTSRSSLIIDDATTIETIITTLGGAKDVAQPLAGAAESSVINSSNLSLSDLSDRIKRTGVTDEQRRESSGYLLNAISSFLKYTGVPTPQRPETSTVRDEAWKNVVSQLPSEQQAEYNKLLEEADSPK